MVKKMKLANLHCKARYVKSSSRAKSRKRFTCKPSVGPEVRSKPKSFHADYILTFGTHNNYHVDDDVIIYPGGPADMECTYGDEGNVGAVTVRCASKGHSLHSLDV